MHPPPQEDSGHGIKRAIVADDDEFFRMALTSILKTHFEVPLVVETASFDEAVEVLNQPEFGGDGTLAIFDLTMPGMTGAGCLAAVREARANVLVTIVSASSRRSDILEALAAGVHGYIPKRLGANELCRAFAYVMAGEIYVPASLAELDARPQAHEAYPSGDDVADGRRARDLNLTPRQSDVLSLVVGGKSNKEIARVLKLSEGTIKIHVASLLRALGVQNRSAAAVAGARLRAQTGID